MASILVVGGGDARAHGFVDHLRVAGHGVTRIPADDARLQSLLRERGPAMVIVDAIESGGGVQRCAEVRAAGARELAVMVLLPRAEATERIAILELGADDCISDPFHVRELLLRVRAVLRRRGLDGRPALPERIGPLTFDRHAHRAWVDGVEVLLTVSELRLLLHLYDACPRVVTRETLQRALGAPEPSEPQETPSRALDAMVKRLRRKLGAAGPCIETVRSVGYRLSSTPPNE